MERHMHTTDVTGYDYMANTGQEEQDRDTIGIIVSVLLLLVVAGCQYLGMI